LGRPEFGKSRCRRQALSWQALADPDGARANPRNLMGFLDAFKAIAMF
jgi:hypothetical protein